MMHMPPPPTREEAKARMAESRERMKQGATHGVARGSLLRRDILLLLAMVGKPVKWAWRKVRG